MRLFERGLEVDPLTPLSHAIPGFAAILEGRYADALEPYRTFYEMDPDSPFSRWCYVWAHCWNRCLDEAEVVFDLLRADYPETTFAALGASLLYGLRGNRQRAVTAITPALKAAAEHSEMFSRELTHCYALAGETAEALDWLENTVRIGHINYPFLSKHDWFLDSLRGETRFQRLMERVKHEWEQLRVSSVSM